MNIIKYKGKVHVFSSATDELPHIYNERLWFIVKNKDKYEKTELTQLSQLSQLIELSHIWVNNKYYNLEYDQNIMKKLFEFSI